MSLFKNKLVAALPVIVLAIVFVFSLTAIPSINPAAKNLPVAIVNEDAGLSSGQNMGSLIVSNIQSATDAISEQPPIKWVKVGSEEAAKAGLNSQDYYAALVIPKDYSANQASLASPEPVSPEITIYVNQGMNMTAANMSQQILTQMVSGLNEKIRAQLIAAFDQQGGTLTTKQAAALASPIASKVIPVNPVGANSANGNAPVTLFQPLWMGSLIGSVIFLLAKNKMKSAGRADKLRANGLQVVWGAFLALVTGFGLTWFADSWGLSIPDFLDVALFLSIAYFAFFLMISAVFSWIGFGGMGIFVLFLFFGAPLLSFAPELLSPFYRDWVMSWLPMRFMVDGLREIFFFGGGLKMNHPTSVLMWIGIVSLLVLLASSLKPSKAKHKEQTQAEMTA
ncbi:YhgE/Pip domain-containing protein [Paenibacillus pinistramenti]|uniref:YhgE/Pip domain-containing protein n=1 Tax=Paenibacillus pinistramenti TaxID=1768003 RepID=UPI001108D04D|nr:ABC transporter permease [Paenibacillus pinistramenti]